MIVRKENGILKMKAVFSLNDNDLYVINEEDFKLTTNSLIVELEVAEMLGEKVISLELIALGYIGIDAYKKYVITESDLSIGDGKIHFSKIYDMYMNGIKNKSVISTIIVDTILAYDSRFFC